MSPRATQLSTQTLATLTPLDTWAATSGAAASRADLGSLKVGPVAAHYAGSKVSVWGAGPDTPVTEPPPATKPDKPDTDTPGHQPLPSKPGKNPMTEPGEGKPCRDGPCTF